MIQIVMKTHNMQEKHYRIKIKYLLALVSKLELFSVPEGGQRQLLLYPGELVKTIHQVLNHNRNRKWNFIPLYQL